MNLQNWVSIAFVCFILLFIFFLKSNNKWHSIAMSDLQFSHRIIIELTLFATILIAVTPMPLSPYWNGSLKLFADKQQYDRLGDALLQGHLYIDNGDIDPVLKTMDNPYDFKEREKLGVKYHWDEAYYNHHYYMYFGIVPTIILFIPFKFLFGTALLSYQATQIFATVTIIGLFYLFYILCKHYFSKFPFSLYLLFSSAFSILSIGYSISAPALYCTAIVSGVCMMVLAVICFFKGAWFETENSKESVCYLFFGSLLGALAFGCRPPVGLANLIIIAVVYQVLKKDRYTNIEKRNIFIVMLLPYIIVGLLLMLYNFARFDNVFEFGQSYQLTIADQHNYSSFMGRFNTKELFMGLLANFYIFKELTSDFPFIQHNGAFGNFPILLFSAKIFSKNVVKFLKEKKLYLISLLLILVPVIISVFTIFWTPFLLERYHLDFYYLLCIASFIVIAAWLEIVSEKQKQWLVYVLTVLLFSVFVVEFFFFLLPIDGSYTFYYPKVLDEVYKGLRFGL